MIGVTIGIGDGWEDCADRASEQMHAMTGLDCRVLKGYGDPVHASWFKHRILELYPGLDGYLYFDADILPLKPWNPEKIFRDNGRKICVVLDNDPRMASQVRDEEEAIGIPNGTYLNAGLFIFGREHAPVFEATWARRPHWHRWIDQSAWNRALWDLKTPVAVLPDIYNHLHKALPETINAHHCGLNGDWRELERAQKQHFTQASADKRPSATVLPRT